MKHYEQYVEPHRQRILDALDYIWKNPETGYREWKTHAYLEEAFAKLGYELTLAGDIPGFTALVDTGREGPTIAVFGEMDALINEGHPEADPVTGAVHSCGHCAQLAALLGLAAALTEPGVLDKMCGKILLVAVPAEELIEVEFRSELRKKGIIRYMGGKQEFLARGLLDGVDMAFMFHTYPGDRVLIDAGSNGCVAKYVRYEGVSSHAGNNPYDGVNALYAANLGLHAINALRETFLEDQHLRVHPIMTAGGDAVNAVPDTAKLESYVRGRTMEEILRVNKKVNRALAGTAAAMGAKVHLLDVPGYWPENSDTTLMELSRDAIALFLDKVDVDYGFGSGSTDMGDISAIMPTVQPAIIGASGKGHGVDYYITDPEVACVTSAKAQLVLLAMLLEDDAAKAKKILAEHKNTFDSVEDYLKYMDSIFLDRQVVSYDQAGKVTLDL